MVLCRYRVGLPNAERCVIEKQKADAGKPCDHFGCKSTAVEVLGFVRELNQAFAVCSEHAPPAAKGTDLFGERLPSCPAERSLERASDKAAGSLS